jgi:hypothetical protein
MPDATDNSRTQTNTTKKKAGAATRRIISSPNESDSAAKFLAKARGGSRRHYAIDLVRIVYHTRRLDGSSLDRQPGLFVRVVALGG